MFSFAKKKIVGGAQDAIKSTIANDNAGGVNWQEFNYPPCLTVVHFEPEKDAIPPLAKKTVLRMKYCWYYAMGILIFNICSNIGFAAAKTDPSVVILYSSLQFVAGSVAGGAVLYQGYRGVAGDLARNSRIYIGLQSVLTILMIVFASIQSGNLHGFSGISSRINTASQPGYLVLCILEGTMWLVCAFFSIYCMYRVWRYPGHDRATRMDTATKTAAASTSKKSRHRERNPEASGEESAPSEKKKKKSKKPPPPTDDATEDVV